MKIVTGHKGTSHITANDDQGLNQGIIGTGCYVLNVGNKFAASITNSTTLRIQDGEGMLHGVHFRVLPGTVDTVALTGGVVDNRRIDLVCARYTKSSTTGVEDVNWVVITGSPALVPTAPTYNDNDVRDGALISDFPIYQIFWNGLTPVLSRLHETLITAAEMAPAVYDLAAFIGSDTALHMGAQTATANPVMVHSQSFVLDPGAYIVQLRCIFDPASGEDPWSQYITPPINAIGSMRLTKASDDNTIYARIDTSCYWTGSERPYATDASGAQMFTLTERTAVRFTLYYFGKWNVNSVDGNAFGLVKVA